MMAGHYATALVANERLGMLSGNVVNGRTLFYFLIASQLPDLLWVMFHFVGIESTAPDSVLDMTLKSLTVDMMYSHDLVPSFLWTILVAASGWALFRSKAVGFAGGILVLVHVACDYVAGYPHHVFGTDSPSIGFAAYHSVTLQAVAWEGLFTTAVLIYFFHRERRRGIQRSRANRIVILGLFVFNVAFLASFATTSMRQWFGLGNLDNTFTAMLPNMLATYWGMIIVLLLAVRRTKVVANEHLFPQ